MCQCRKRTINGITELRMGCEEVEIDTQNGVAMWAVKGDTFPSDARNLSNFNTLHVCHADGLRAFRAFPSV